MTKIAHQLAKLMQAIVVFGYAVVNKPESENQDRDLQQVREQLFITGYQQADFFCNVSKLFLVHSS
jgi:hypothetical protein